MNSDHVAERSNRIAELIQEKLGVRGPSLEAKVCRSTRDMPRWVRKEAQTLIEAQRLLAHPKLMMQADMKQIDTAYHACEKWLASVNPSERRKTKLLGFLATNAFNLLLVGLMFVVALRLTGQV